MNSRLIRFLVLAAPPVQTAGRGRVHLRRGSHSTYKLMFELCVSFLKLKFINPHTFLYKNLNMFIIIIIDLQEIYMHILIPFVIYDK